MEKNNKLNLFNDDDDNNEDGDDGVDLQLGPLKEERRYSDRKTSKLIELQSKYAYDPRFKIDERFIDDDDDEGDNRPKSEVEIETEKNLEILEKVLGKRVRKSEPVETSKKGSMVPRSTLLTPRFDPSKEECKIYELEPKSGTKRRVANIDLDEIDKKIEMEKMKKKKKVSFDPESKSEDKSERMTQVDVGENYYEVQKDLKDTLANTEDFSLGSFLGLEPVDEEREARKKNKDDEYNYEPITGAGQKYQMRNPFKYDSSESEGEEEDATVKITLPKEHTLRPAPVKPFAGFFFAQNDQRLEEDLFYTKELVDKAKANGKERSILMMRAMSLRKKSANKNLKSEQKFTKKQKERLKHMRKNRKQIRRMNVFKHRNVQKRNQR